jgi:hypothetical protein
LTFTFNSTPKFNESFNGLSLQEQEMIRKRLGKIANFPLQHIQMTAPFLKGEYAGMRHDRTGRLRIYLRVCKECMDCKHYSRYWQCEGCESIRTDFMIILFDVKFRRDDTYNNLDITEDDAKSITEFNA